MRLPLNDVRSPDRNGEPNRICEMDSTKIEPHDIDAGAETSVFGGSTFGTGTSRFGFVGIGSEATEFNGRPNATGYFDGDLDEVRIYDRSLTPTEIAYLADESPADGRLYVPVPSVANVADEEPEGSRAVNFKDFAVLTDQWLEEGLWPTP